MAGTRKYDLTKLMMIYSAGGFLACLILIVVGMITKSSLDAGALITLYTMFLGGTAAHNGIFTAGNAAEHNAEAKKGGEK